VAGALPSGDEVVNGCPTRHDGAVNMLAALPRPSDSRLALKVTPDAIRQLRGGHPWLFEGSIKSVSREGAPGDLAVVFNDDREFVGIGLWDPASPIRVKILHVGSPQAIDAAFFERRLAAAVALRAPLADSAGTPTATTAYRVVHGENDKLPGLVVDRYGHVVVVKLYSAAWIPHLATIVPILRTLVPFASVVVRIARSMADQPLHGIAAGMSLMGPDIDSPVPFYENGLRFEADVILGQKTGHFLDQRENRILVGSAASGARVLDVFSCNGGFGVHAAAGGARSVLSIDAAPGAIRGAERNMDLNRDLPAVAACRHETTIGEAFATLEKLNESRGRFDIVVVDPPSFAQNAPSIPKALVAYERLAQLAVPLVERGGLLVQASCSSRVEEAAFLRAVHTGAARSGYDLVEERRTGHPLDHPIGFREGAYLKALYARPTRTPRTP
jgi:23S rRNA (cytosine1962-C5)-methyltransferase